MKQIFNQSEAGTTQIWVLTRHQYGIFAHIPQTSFRRKTSGGFVHCWLFCQANSEAEREGLILLFRFCLRDRQQTIYFSLDRTRHSHKRNQKTVFTGSSCCTLLITVNPLLSPPSQISPPFSEEES